MENNFLKEQHYLKAKKRVKDIKGFYVHFIVFCTTMPVIIATNLIFVPGFHWFWFSLTGWGVGIFFHWLGVFGFQLLGLGKNWEELKIKEIMDKNKY